jgi:transcriptional regulator with XRE-family HTH domain
MSKARRSRRVSPIKPRYVYCSHEQFCIERFTAGFTRLQAADYLGVSIRTIRNWESGKNRIPYPAFKLLRMRAKGLVNDKRWEGWRFTPDGALCSPVGRSYLPMQLENLSNVFGMAKMAHQLYLEKRDLERRLDAHQLQ